MKTSNQNVRYESDSMGNVPIPAWAYWGAQTQRAVDNFQVSDHTLPKPMVRALGLIKHYAAMANAQLGLLDQDLAKAIAQAAAEVAKGQWDEHFPVDVFQTGSATSSNMNTNEVIANRANELLGAPLGARHPVHPNDHVNKGQSSNDVIPATVQLASRLAAAETALAVGVLADAFQAKAEEFSQIIKLGRTHLQDAVPMTLGQEFGAFAAQLRKCVTRIETACVDLEELPLGGTAVGTGLNCHPEFSALVCAGLAQETGVMFRTATNRFELIAARDAQVALMGALNTLATVIMKIANDLRLLASGPRGALGEIEIPSLQPGSSIMPGKINPVIPEMLIQVAAHICGKAVSVTIAGQNSPLQLNMMHPLIGFEVLESCRILSRACTSAATDCVAGIKADAERCRYWLDWSLALATPLNQVIGYDQAAALVYRAFKEQKKVIDLVVEEGLLSAEEAAKVLDPKGMI
jgi:fumarate hydratase class II